MDGVRNSSSATSSLHGEFWSKATLMMLIKNLYPLDGGRGYSSVANNFHYKLLIVQWTIILAFAVGVIITNN